MQGTSLVDQWLQVPALPMQGAQVQSLVKEMRSPMLHSAEKGREGEKERKKGKSMWEN